MPFGHSNGKETDGSYLLNQKQKIIELVETSGLQEVCTVATFMRIPTDFLKGREESEPLLNNSKPRKAIGKHRYCCGNAEQKH